jgi:hypothetical protein
MSEIEAPPPPRISEEGLTFYREQLARYEARQLAGKLTVVDAERYQSLKASVAGALAVSGQQLEPQGDGRSAPQAAHDARYGVSFDDKGAVALPAILAALCDKENPNLSEHTQAQVRIWEDHVARWRKGRP